MGRPYSRYYCLVQRSRKELYEKHSKLLHFSKDCTTLGIKKRQLKYNTRVLFDVDEHSSFTKQCLEFDKSKSKYK